MNTLNQKIAAQRQLTTDNGMFFRRDPIASAEDAGSTPTSGFRASSKSVKDCRLSPGQSVRPRVKTATGITGGFVFDAEQNPTVGPEWAHVRTPRKRCNAGKNARKRAARALAA